MDNKPTRKPLRIRQYDYNTSGAYFVTFCTHNKQRLLSYIVGAIHESPALRLTTYGRMVDDVLQTLPSHLPVKIDSYVIMPNHVHLLLQIVQPDLSWAIHESPLQQRSTLSKTIGYIKMNASKSIRRSLGDVPVWQRGYHDHVVRNQDDYNAIAEYIANNPLRWELDSLYTAE